MRNRFFVMLWLCLNGELRSGTVQAVNHPITFHCVLYATLNKIKTWSMVATPAIRRCGVYRRRSPVTCVDVRTTDRRAPDEFTADYSQAINSAVCADGILALTQRIKQRKLLEKNADLESIRALSWNNFEYLVGEAFRQQGYRVNQHGGAGPDGGVDLMLHRQGKKTAVQCKHWHAGKVGAPVIREHLGAMTAQGADKGIVVCSGEFTQPAIDFAADNGIKLINGLALERLIGAKLSALPTPPETQSLPCPSCDSTMVVRKARKGASAGNQFLGCSRFPKCHGTRSLT